MMNEARLAVGIQGLSQSEIAYQNAVAYAKDRRQGRSLTGVKDADKPADTLMVHPDVRRNLMSIRAFNEAARAAVMWTAIKADVSHKSDNEADRQAADDHMSLMTPILKGVLTDVGFDNAVKAQQMFGGHGYVEEWGMSQFVRDARIAMIYEGANGVQAMDLVGRKLGKDGGRAIMTFFNEVGGFIQENSADEAMGPYVKPLQVALGHLQQSTMWFMNNAMVKPDNAGAGANDYMHMFGLVLMGYMWAKMAKAAQDKLKAGANGATDRMNAKLITGRFYMERTLPETAAHLARLSTGSDSTMALAAEAF
jgi:acyl-CoA dehydrogenase